MSDASTSRARHHLLVGDAANALALVSTVLFLAAALTKARFLSPAWRSLGFCITNPDSPALSSHAMCFYLDLVGAAGLAVLYGLGRNRVSPAAAARVLVNVPGTLGHGVGHGYLAMAMGRDPQGPGAWDSKGRVLGFIAILFFWYALLGAALPTCRRAVVAAGALLNVAAGRWVPPALGFTYVQTVLIAAQTVTQLRLPREAKGYDYAAFACVVVLPLGLVGWLEATTCGGFLERWGGHVWYDAYIPASVAVYWGLCAREQTRDLQKRR